MGTPLFIDGEKWESLSFQPGLTPESTMLPNHRSQAPGLPAWGPGRGQQPSLPQLTATSCSPSSAARPPAANQRDPRHPSVTDWLAGSRTPPAPCSHHGLVGVERGAGPRRDLLWPVGPSRAWCGQRPALDPQEALTCCGQCRPVPGLASGAHRDRQRGSGLAADPTAG